MRSCQFQSHLPRPPPPPPHTSSKIDQSQTDSVTIPLWTGADGLVPVPPLDITLLGFCSRQLVFGEVQRLVCDTPGIRKRSEGVGPDDGERGGGELGEERSGDGALRRVRGSVGWW